MKRTLKNCLIAACWLLLWQLGAMAVGSPVLLPSPWETAKAFVALAGTGFFWKIGRGNAPARGSRFPARHGGWGSAWHSDRVLQVGG